MAMNWDIALAEREYLEGVGGDSLQRYSEALRLDALRLGAVLLRAFALLSGWVKRGRAILIPAVILFELYTFGAEFNGLIRSSAYEEVPPTAQSILDRHTGPSPPRVLSFVNERNSPFDWHNGWSYDPSSYHRYTETLRPYSAGLYGLGNALPGWSPLHLTRHWDLARLFPRMARFTGVEYAVSYGPLAQPGLTRIREGEIQVYTLANSAPRAFVTTDYVVIKDEKERLRHIRQNPLDWRRVVLEEAPQVEKVGGDEAGQAMIVRYENEEVLVEVEGHRGGLLVLNDTYYPGWRAFVDGAETPILQANHVFRAVVIPPRSRQVHFRFDSDSIRWGGWISGTGWFCWMITLVLSWSKVGWVLPLSSENVLIGRSAAIACAQGALVVLLYGACVRWSLWSGALSRMQALINWGG